MKSTKKKETLMSNYNESNFTFTISGVNKIKKAFKMGQKSFENGESYENPFSEFRGIDYAQHNAFRMGYNTMRDLYASF